MSEPGRLECDVVRVWPPADPITFRQGLSKLATSAAIVACQTPVGPRGLLVGSVATVSTAPPRLLVCVEKASAAHVELLTAEAVSIALLAADQRQVAEDFDVDGLRFDTTRWRLDPAAPPALNDALATFAGPIRCRIDAGAATLFVIDVSTAHSRDGSPLVRLAGAVQALG